jgi:hypothetical protein
MGAAMIDETEDILNANALVDLIVSSMVTYLLIEGKTGEWRDWLRAKILAPGEKDSEVKVMYQAMTRAPDEVIEDAVYAFVSACRDKARIMKLLPKGFFNG